MKHSVLEKLTQPSNRSAQIVGAGTTKQHVVRRSVLFFYPTHYKNCCSGVCRNVEFTHADRMVCGLNVIDFKAVANTHPLLFAARSVVFLCPSLLQFCIFNVQNSRRTVCEVCSREFDFDDIVGLSLVVTVLLPLNDKINRTRKTSKNKNPPRQTDN